MRRGSSWPWRPAARRSSVARSSRRCRRRSPKCDRWSSAAMRVGSASASRMVDELRRRARREGFDRCARSPTMPAFFVRRGFSIVPHAWVPEKIAHDCIACPLFRNCGQYAIVLSSIGRRPFGRRSMRGVRSDRANDRPTIAERARGRGRRHGAVGLSRQRPALRHQGQRQARSLADRQLIAPATAAGVFTTNQAKAAPLSSRRSTWRRATAWRRRSSPTAAAPTRAPARRAWPTRARWRCSRPTALGCTRASRAGRVDRRHRRQPEDGRDPRRHSAGGGRAGRATAAPPRRARS